MVFVNFDFVSWAANWAPIFRFWMNFRRISAGEFLRTYSKNCDNSEKRESRAVYPISIRSKIKIYKKEKMLKKRTPTSSRANAASKTAPCTCRQPANKKKNPKVAKKEQKRTNNNFRFKATFAGLIGSLEYKKKQFEAKLALPVFYKLKIGIFCAYE